MYLISPGVSGCGVQRRKDGRRASRVALVGAVIVLMAVAAFAVGSRRVEAAGAAGKNAGVAQTAGAKTADFPLTAHVTASSWEEGFPTNTVEVTIDSVNYRMITRTYAVAFLALGDYPARIVVAKKPSKLAAYWVNGAYEFQCPDGKVVEFSLVGQWAR